MTDVKKTVESLTNRLIDSYSCGERVILKSAAQHGVYKCTG